MDVKECNLDRMANAERFAFLLGTLPKEKQKAVVMMANAFLSGMEAQQRIAEESAEAARPSA